jgi:hypothetical protein
MFRGRAANERRFSQNSQISSPPGIKAAPMRIGHQSIELRAFFSCPNIPTSTYSTAELPGAALAVLFEFSSLERWVLTVVRSADTRVNRYSEGLL